MHGVIFRKTAMVYRNDHDKNVEYKVARTSFARRMRDFIAKKATIFYVDECSFNAYVAFGFQLFSRV